jgi:hypothetical protein
MSKKKKDKKDKKVKGQTEKAQAEGNRLSKAGKNAAALGTALVGAVAAEGAQATLPKWLKKERLAIDSIRFGTPLKKRRVPVKNVASALHDALDDADIGVVDAATSLTDKAKDTAEDTQASAEKALEAAVDTLKDVIGGAKSSSKPGKKHKA